MTVHDIIDGLLEREGEGTPPYHHPHDQGGRTSWGISERAHPDAWQPGPPTKDEAREIYWREYVAPFNALATYGADDRIRVVLVDDAVLSGLSAAIKRMQVVLGGLRIDGIFGPLTTAAVLAADPDDLLKRFTVERAIRITRLVQRRPSDLVFLTGWITRILRFLP